MSYLVKDFIGKKGKKGDIGIEIEVEAFDALPMGKMDHWVPKHEGSIRDGGVEYVTSGPLVITEVPKAIKDLTDLLSKNKIRHDSPRTSVHMHSNVLHHTPKEYWTLVCAYWLTENLLYDFCGDYRRGNSFCLSLQAAEGVLGYCHKDLKQDMPFSTLGIDNIRYAGQNLAATIKFGSIEYRGMSFTLDPLRLNTWAKQLYLMRLNSKDFDSPARLMDEYFMADGSKDFLSRIFDRDFVDQITSKPDWKDKLEANEGVICELAYVHDWDAWEKRINKAREVKGEPKLRYDEDQPDIPAPRPRAARPIRAAQEAMIQGQQANAIIIDDVVPQANDIFWR